MSCDLPYIFLKKRRVMGVGSTRFFFVSNPDKFALTISMSTKRTGRSGTAHLADNCKCRRM